MWNEERTTRNNILIKKMSKMSRTINNVGIKKMSKMVWITRIESRNRSQNRSWSVMSYFPDLGLYFSAKYWGLVINIILFCLFWEIELIKIET